MYCQTKSLHLHQLELVLGYWAVKVMNECQGVETWYCSGADH